MTHCPLCASASHVYDRNCPDCVIRDLARSPQHHREAAYSAMARVSGVGAARDMRNKVIEAYRAIVSVSVGKDAA